jgi:hypothetical protein
MRTEAAPPILRPDLVSKMKVLTVSAPHDKLNRFQMFLALSDRATRTEGEFLRWPHTTKLIWGSHRIIYIFTDATGGLSLYYDIELREPLESKTTGGAMLRAAPATGPRSSAGRRRGLKVESCRRWQAEPRPLTWGWQMLVLWT